MFSNTALSGGSAMTGFLWLRQREQVAMAWGLLGVAIFALTLPMTGLAVGTAAQPQLGAVMVAVGRAAIAGVLSVLLLVWVRAPWPCRKDWGQLALTSVGVVLGFPLWTSWAMQHVHASHASVIVGLLPFATALLGAVLHRQRPSIGFWACAVAGFVVIAGFATMRSGAGVGGLSAGLADAGLLAGVLMGGMGYAVGGRLAQRMPAPYVISWALVLALPITVPVSVWLWPAAGTPIAPSAWWGLGYLGVFSMWLGFFAWYRGLALGGTVRVSQVQLVQPLLSIALSIPLLGEHPDAATWGFAAAVIATVMVGRRMPVDTHATHAAPVPTPAALRSCA